MDAIAQVGKFLGSDTGKGVMTAGTAGGGFLQNWMANREAQKKQKFVEDLITHPDKFQKFVSGFEKPLTQGLSADVARQTDAYGAERGLGSSPAVMKDVYAQALAPYVMQQKDAATRAAMQALGIYEESPTTKPVDISSIFKMLQMQGGGGGGKVDMSGITMGPPDSVPPETMIPGGNLLPQPSVGGGDSGLF